MREMSCMERLVITILACRGGIVTVLARFQTRQWASTGCMTLRWLLQVTGYVKAVSSAGVFVVLARNAEARVKMGHLSDSFVKYPKEAFPEGKLVEGRVISAADGRCWIQSDPQALDLSCKAMFFAGCANAL